MGGTQYENYFRVVMKTSAEKDRSLLLVTQRYTLFQNEALSWLLTYLLITKKPTSQSNKY